MPVSPLWLLSFWFWLASLSSGALWSYGAAFVVLVGVIGETVTEFTEWIKPESRKERVKKISAIVLILGLTGDLLAIRETQLEVATLTKEAGDAKSRQKEQHPQRIAPKHLRTKRNKKRTLYRNKPTRSLSGWKAPQENWANLNSLFLSKARDGDCSKTTKRIH